MQGKTTKGNLGQIQKKIVDELKSEVKQLNSKLIFDNIKVFKSIIVTVRKKHQCVKCGGTIPKGNYARNTVFRYDGRLVSVYFCAGCNIGL